MRIRSIRPEFWSSEDIAALPWDTRLVFIGLWSYVDDNGVGRDVERLIVADLFPLDEDLDECSRKVHGALKLLADGGQITRYVVDGKAYLHVTAFAAHQVINRPSKGRYPGPASENARPADSISDDSVSTHPTPGDGEGEKGRRGEGEKSPTAPHAAPNADGPPKTAANRGTRVPDGFAITDEMRTFGRELGFGDKRIEMLTASFVDYWKAAPGQKGVKLDWPATWRNWLRREAEQHPPRGASGGSSELRPWEL